jgi:putative ABC transport system permease protein
VRIAAESAPQRGVNDKLTYYAIDPNTYRNISDIQFIRGQGSNDSIWQQFRTGRSLFISTVVSDIHHLKQGDRLFIETKQGSQPFTVAAVMVDFNPKAYIIYGPMNDAYHWFGQTGVDSFFLSVKSGYSVEDVKSEIEKRYKKARSITTISSEQLHSQILTLVGQSFDLLDSLNYIGMIISALGVINTLMMNIMERQQEIGGMRSIGMTRSQVIKMIISEGSTLGIIGGFFGLATGVIMAEQMVRALNLMASYDLSLVLPPHVFLWGAGIALIVAQAAAYYPAWKAARVNIIEAIQHE